MKRNDDCFHLSIFERDGCFYLSLLFKEAYGVDPKHKAPYPLRPLWRGLQEDLIYCRHPERSAGAMLYGRDLWPDRSKIDLIVKGQAHAPGGRKCSQMEIDVAFENRRMRARVFGDRIAYRVQGKLRFSSPQAFHQLPVDAFHAYGGIDPNYVPSSLADTPSVLGEPILERFPGAYPRNPCGMGYWISPKNFIDGLRLPNIEDEENLLTPDRFFLHDPRRWPLARQPFLCGFIGLTTFPRAIFAGQDPYYQPRAGQGDLLAALAEECPLELLNRQAGQLSIGREMMQNGSPRLRIEENMRPLSLKVRGMTPKGELELSIPRPSSEVRIHEEGRLRVAQIKRLAIQLCTQRQRLELLCSAQLPLGTGQQHRLRQSVDLDALAQAYRVEIGPHLLDRSHWPRERPRS